MIRWKWGPVFFAILCSLLTNCGGGETGDLKTDVEKADRERVEKVQEILERQIKELPSEISAAHFLEEQIGDGRLGPSDFKSFCRFQVPVDQVSDWTSLFGNLEPHNDPPTFVAPIGKSAWWISLERLKTLTFYSPRKLSGRGNGWIGVDPETGDIFVYSFTM